MDFFRTTSIVVGHFHVIQPWKSAAMGACGVRCSRRTFLPIVGTLIGLLIGLVGCVAVAGAQLPDFKNVGRAPTPDEIKAWDITVGPDGKGLPAGSGTAKDGAAIFAAKCAGCHGRNSRGNAVRSDPGWWSGHAYIDSPGNRQLGVIGRLPRRSGII